MQLIAWNSFEPERELVEFGMLEWSPAPPGFELSDLIWARAPLPEDFRTDHSEVDWRKIAGMRDKLIHDYPTVDYELVWDVVDAHIPELLDHVEEWLDE